MNRRKLIRSAIELVQVGKELDAAKKHLEALVDQNLSYESDEMKKALQKCLDLKEKWELLEQEHLIIKSKF